MSDLILSLIIVILGAAIPVAYYIGRHRNLRQKPQCRNYTCSAYADPECGSGFCTYHCRVYCGHECCGRRDPKPCKHCGMAYHDHASPKCTASPTYYEPK